ncbi:RhuM family protein [Algibacter pectinivorans]|uniref:Uncharacterized conserved protein n=1 Tax=Algibacter pectinivorans TaxID=870482 RepID=A0A1I1R1P6_9FLAO|nr:RhuM family protein [Algibacter pectinivorans]SFD28239.1 Uncharacterized conserved protein [Algibacter pectinivorans]
MEKGEILIYTNQEGNIKIDVRLQEETVWLTQEQMALLFNRDRSVITKHIGKIFSEGELDEKSNVQKMHISTSDKPVKIYNLDVVISVGYRVKSQQGTQFRIWATQRLKEYIIKGFALNDERFKTGTSMNYFNELQNRIREIRISEKFFYQKIKDIYATSIDYNPKDEKTIQFFKIVQNKLLWAISQKTAAELVYRSVDASLPLMGMLAYDKKNKSVTKSEAGVAKNYLNEDEMRLLGLIVEQYLAFAETMVQQQTPMYMKDWVQRLDAILQLNGRELLTHAGKISQEMAKNKVAKEYQKYKEENKRLSYEKSLKELEQDIKNLKDKK